jgi:hypothetical protein
MDNITKSGLLFGLYLQPFAKQAQGEFEVPKIEGINPLIQLRMIFSDVPNALLILIVTLRKSARMRKNISHVIYATMILK